MRHGGETLRVAVVGPYPPATGRTYGGVEGATSALCDGLAAVDGVEAHAVTSVAGLARPEERATDTGVHVHLVPLFNTLGCLTRFAIDGARIRKALRRIDPHVVHVHTSLMYAHSAMGRAWPSVLTIHGIYYRETASKRGKDWLQTRLACQYEINAVRNARHISALNHYTVGAFKDYVRTEDIRYIDNPCNDRFFSVPDHAEPGRILFGGFIYDLKNLLYLLQAVARLVPKHSDVKLRVAGGVRDQSYYERCLAFIEEQGIGRNVEFLGALGVEEMMEEHSKASMLVLCSKQENAPMIISEAMAAGKPVIGTPVGGVAEMIEEGKTGFVVPLDDAGQLAERIALLLDDADPARQMGQAGKRLAEQRFKRSVVVGKTIDFYKDVIASERGRR